MNTENEYKEFSEYWSETIKGDNWTTLERQACFMGWLEAKKRSLNLYNVSKSFECGICQDEGVTIAGIDCTCKNDYN